MINEFGRERVKSWVKKFGMDSSLYGIDQATDLSSGGALIDQMEQYSAAAFKVAKEPELRDYWRIRARLRSKRIRYGKEWAPINDMRAAFRAGFTIEQLDQAAEEATDYRDFCERIGFTYKHPREES